MSFRGPAAWKSPVFKLPTTASLTAIGFTHYTALSRTAPHAKVLGGVPKNQGGTFFSEAQQAKVWTKVCILLALFLRCIRDPFHTRAPQIGLSTGRGAGNPFGSA